MKNYETYVVIKATLTTEEIEERITKVKDHITTLGGEILSVDDFGIKNLAFEIDKNKRGHTLSIYHKSTPESIKEIERVYRITEDVLRYLTVKYETKKELEALDAILNNKLVLNFVTYNRENKDGENREYKPRYDRKDGENREYKPRYDRKDGENREYKPRYDRKDGENSQSKSSSTNDEV